MLLSIVRKVTFLAKCDEVAPRVIARVMVNMRRREHDLASRYWMRAALIRGTPRAAHSLRALDIL
jgi:hypothetical protein